MVRDAIDRRQTRNNVTGNSEVMGFVRQVDASNAWAIGRFDVLRAQHRLPPQVESQIPPISWFSISGQIDDGIRGVLRADARDDESASNLRDVVRGFLAFVKLQSGGRPEFKGVVQSLELSGTGRTVALSFDVPRDVIDAAGQLHAR